MSCLYFLSRTKPLASWPLLALTAWPQLPRKCPSEKSARPRLQEGDTDAAAAAVADENHILLYCCLASHECCKQREKERERAWGFEPADRVASSENVPRQLPVQWHNVCKIMNSVNSIHLFLSHSIYNNFNVLQILSSAIKFFMCKPMLIITWYSRYMLYTIILHCFTVETGKG